MHNTRNFVESCVHFWAVLHMIVPVHDWNYKGDIPRGFRLGLDGSVFLSFEPQISAYMRWKEGAEPVSGVGSNF